MSDETAPPSGFRDPTIHGRQRKPVTPRVPARSTPSNPSSASASASAAPADAKRFGESVDLLHKKIDIIGERFPRELDRLGSEVRALREENEKLRAAVESADRSAATEGLMKAFKAELDHLRKDLASTAEPAESGGKAPKAPRG